MSIIELSKAKVSTLKYYAELETAGNPPTFTETVKTDLFTTGLVSYLVCAKLDACVLVAGTLLTALTTKVNQMTYTQRSGHKIAYTNWLNSMNNNNFQEIRIQLFNYQLVADGVYFTADIPNVLAYKDSSGNWVEQY